VSAVCLANLQSSMTGWQPIGKPTSFVCNAFVHGCGVNWFLWAPTVSFASSILYGLFRHCLNHAAVTRNLAAAISGHDRHK
jgi:hypothetical protein